MQVGILSEDSIADAVTMGIAARTRITGKGIGIKQMNLQPDVKYITNLLHTGKTLPLSLAAYKTEVSNVENNLEVKPAVITIENEILSNERNFNMSMYFDMLEYNCSVWRPKGVRVATSGITMPALVALGLDYLIKNGKKEEAAAYRTLWGHVYTGKLEAALTGFDLLNSVNPDVDCNFHFCVSKNNVDELPFLLSVLKAYTSKPVVCNELSFADQDASLVTRALTHLQSLDYVVLYSNWGNVAAKPLTQEMKAAMVNFI